MGRVREGHRMKIYFEQIPDDVDFRDYPEGGICFGERRPERDPVTFKVMLPPRRNLIYPRRLQIT